MTSMYIKSLLNELFNEKKTGEVTIVRADEIYDNPNEWKKVEPYFKTLYALSTKEDNKFAKKVTIKPTPLSIGRFYALMRRSFVFAAMVNEKPVGMIAVRPYSDSDGRRTNGFIHDFIVSPKFRNKGIGSSLMNKIEEFGRKNRYKYLELDIWASNAVAERMYNKYGFITTEKRMRKKL